jgi:predicted O-methyltransferase YrrM
LREIPLSLLSSLIKDVVGKNKQGAPEAAPAATSQRTVEAIYAEIKASLEVGNIAGAEKLFAELTTSYPGIPGLKGVEAEIHAATMHQRFPGPDYRVWLQWFHAKVKPANYLEIGVETGESLQYAKAPTRCVGVDPGVALSYTLQTWAKLYKQASDDFFRQHDARQVFGSGDIDLAFIDGMHTFDQALRDFINTERYSAPGSVILFHDILPVVPATASREQETTVWIGDTWKVLLLLKKYRPDLKIFTIPTQPSGLAVVVNLAPENRVLTTQLDEIVRDGFSMKLEDYFNDINSHLNVMASNDFDAVNRLLDSTKT